MHTTRMTPGSRPLLLNHKFRCLVVEGRVRSLLVLACLLLWPVCRPHYAAAWEAPCTIQLQAQVLIRNATPVLSDIAGLRGSDEMLVKKLGQIPLGPVTEARTISRADILALVLKVARYAGQVEVTGAGFTRIVLEQRTPEAAEIEALLKAHLVSVTAWREEEIEIRSIDNLHSISLPAGAVQLRISSRGVPANFRRMLLSVEASLAGKSVRNFWVKADVRVRARVVQAVRRIPFRSVLAAGDLREAECEIADPRAGYIRSLDAVIGSIAKRALIEGEVLTQRSVEPASLVRSGETVRLTASVNGTQVSTLVRALQNGKLGDRIKVRNIDSDRALFAFVTGRGEVRIRQ